MKWLTILIPLIFAAIQSYSQDGKFLFSDLTSKDGLANNRVNCILQDARGFMWFGTKEGLSRFDGKTFKNFFEGSTPGSLQGNDITSMVEYEPQHLALVIANKWFATLNTNTNTFSYPPVFQNKTITTIQKGLFNNFFAGSATDTCYELDPGLNIRRTFHPPFTKALWYTTIEQLDTNFIFFGRPGEFFIYDVKNNQFRQYITKCQHIEDPLSFRYYDTATRYLYFSNFSIGLLCFNLSGDKIRQWYPDGLPGHLSTRQITFISKKNKNELWICSADAGLNVLNLANSKISMVAGAVTNQRAAALDAVFQNYTDNENCVWLATSNGIRRLRQSMGLVRSWHNDFNIDNSNTNLSGTVLGTDGNIYQPLLGLPDCFVINQSSDAIRLLDKSKLPGLWAAEDFNDEIIFHGYSTYITRYNLKTKQYTVSDFLHTYFRSSDIITLACKQHNGTEWYSGNQNGGLLRIEKNNTVHAYKKNQQQFGNGYYTYGAEDNAGDMWFGVNKSNLLLHWDHTTDSFHEILFDTVKGISRAGFGGIFDVKFDNRSNNLWIIFESSGIVCYHLGTKTAKQYTMTNGLPTNYMYALALDDKNRVWAGSHVGLSCLQPAEYRCVTFTTGDGLTSDFFDDRCIIFDKPNNKIWAGTTNTLMSFNPDSLLNTKQRKIAVYIDDILVNGALFQKDKVNTASFQPQENNVQFNFTAPDIDGSADIEYSYQLKGGDKDWLYSGSIHSASYNHLSPGDYTFFVRAKHKGSNYWNETNTPFNFHIETPWYGTWWFKLLAIAALSLLILYVSRLYYLRKFEKQQAVEKERTRIATDMHDDFGASLSRIKFISEKIQYNEEKDNDLLKTDLSKISLYSDEMSQKLNQIVWALNQRYDTLGDLVSYCREYAADALIENNIQFLFEENIDPDRALQGEIRRNIFLTLKESVNNIIKHAGATQVHISFSQSNEKIVLYIKDNGKGFHPANIRPFANGLENMKKRIKDIGGTIIFENNNGTMIQVSVPVG